MSIIKDLYYGEIDMQDTACASERYRTELKALVAADNALREALTPEQVTYSTQQKSATTG